MFKSFIRNLIEKAGHRGAFVAFLVLLDVLYGYSILSDPGVLAHASLILPRMVWGIIWIAVGVFLATGIFTKRDKLHFAVASALKVAWAIAYLNVTLVNHVSRAWISIVIWLAFAGLVVVVSFWPDKHRCSRNSGPIPRIPSERKK